MTPAPALERRPHPQPFVVIHEMLLGSGTLNKTRAMNIFELLWFAFWLGAGGALGYRVWSVPGMIVGVGAGFATMRLFSRVLNPHPDDWPACACGANWISSFSFETQPTHSFAHRCKQCGAVYVMRKGTRWSRVLPDGTTELHMTRAWPGRWTPVAPPNPNTTRE